MYRLEKSACLGSLALAFAMLWSLPLFADTKSADAKSPVARITEFTGRVEVATHGDNWRDVKRAKLLFDGYRVRTGSGATATLLGQGVEQEAHTMGSGSLLEVRDGRLNILVGNALEPVRQGGLFGFFADLSKRWSSRQRYTTVRRGVENTVEVDTPSRVTLSADYPTLVFQNAGADFHYRVRVGERSVDVAAAAAGADYVSVQLADLPAGEHAYVIEVLDAGNQLKYQDKRQGRLTILAGAEAAALKAEHQRLLADVTADDDQIATFLSQKGLLVPAMQHLQQYLADNPQEVFMRPSLLEVYAALELKVLKNREAASYQQLARSN